MCIRDSSRDAVGRAPFRDIGDPHVVALAGGDAVEVVLAHEDDGEVPHGRHVDSLVEGAAVGCSVAEEADHDLVRALVLARECRTRADGDSAPDYAVGPQDTEIEVGDMHRAALALAVARG